MKQIRFRQALMDRHEPWKFQKWHYWGFLPVDYGHKNIIFTGPETHSQGLDAALENSFRYLMQDRRGRDVYQGDIVKLRASVVDYGTEKQWVTMTIDDDGGTGSQITGDDAGDYGWEDLMIMQEDIEVIGNVIEGEWDRKTVLEKKVLRKVKS